MPDQREHERGWAYSEILTRVQRQDSLAEQLRDLHYVAGILGMYDAQDWLTNWLMNDRMPDV